MQGDELGQVEVDHVAPRPRRHALALLGKAAVLPGRTAGNECALPRQARRTPEIPGHRKLWPCWRSTWCVKPSVSNRAPSSALARRSARTKDAASVPYDSLVSSYRWRLRPRGSSVHPSARHVAKASPRPAYAPTASARPGCCRRPKFSVDVSRAAAREVGVVREAQRPAGEVPDTRAARTVEPNAVLLKRDVRRPVVVENLEPAAVGLKRRPMRSRNGVACHNGVTFGALGTGICVSPERQERLTGPRPG